MSPLTWRVNSLSNADALRTFCPKESWVISIAAERHVAFPAEDIAISVGVCTAVQATISDKCDSLPTERQPYYLSQCLFLEYLLNTDKESISFSAWQIKWPLLYGEFTHGIFGNERNWMF